MSKRSILVAALTANFLLAIAILLQSNDRLFFPSLITTFSFLILSSFYCSLMISTRNQPVAFMLMLFWCYGMTMPAIYQIGTGILPWLPNSVNFDNLIPAALMNLYAVISFVFGYLTSQLKNRQAQENLPSRYKVDNSFATLFIFISAMIFALYAFDKVGISAFFATRESSSLIIQQSGFNLTSLGLLKTFPSAVAISTFVIISYQRNILKFKNLVMNLLYPLSFLMMITTNFPTNIPRYLMISISFIILCTTFISTYNKNRPLIYFAAPVLIFLVFPFLSSFNRRADLNFSYQLPILEESLKSGDFDGFQSLMNAIILVGVEGYSWGGRLASALLFIIPREIWSGKYQPTGSDAARAAGYDFLNISMPLPGEIYVDFGMLGVVFGMFLFGRLVVYLDEKLESSRNSGFNVEIGMSGIVMAAYMPILFRGTLLAVIAVPASIIAVIFLWGLLRRLRL